MTSNYHNITKRSDTENLQPWIVRVVASVTALATISVGLRLLSRYLKRTPLWWDDWMIIFSLGWNFAVVGFIFAMYSCGMGVHANRVSMDDIVMMAKWLVVAEVLYAWNLCWTKIALLLMYYRIFHFPFFRKMAYVIGAFVVAWGITITFLFIFICVPVQKLWYPDLQGHCIHQVGTWIANAASTILTDLIILLLPIRELWKLQLRRFEKIALSLTFSLGFFVVFASAYRFSVLFEYTATDPTYTLARTVGWTAIEMSAGIVSACLPVLRPIITSFAHTIGLDGSFLRSNQSMGISRPRHSTKPSSNSGADLEMHHSLTTKENSGTWSDGHDSEGLVPPSGVKLRPDHGFEYRVTSRYDDERHDQSDSGSKTNHGIVVRKDFSRIANKQ